MTTYPRRRQNSSVVLVERRAARDHGPELPAKRRRTFLNRHQRLRNFSFSLISPVFFDHRSQVFSNFVLQRLHHARHRTSTEMRSRLMVVITSDGLKLS